VRVADKEGAVAAAAGCGIELGTWFVSPLHNVMRGLEKYGYHWGMCPVAEKAAREVVNLPVHPRASARTVRRTVAFILPFGQPDA